MNERGKQILGREFEIYFAPPPSFAIEKSLAGEIVLLWPGSATGYNLQSTDALLPSTEWSPVNQNAAFVNGRRRIDFTVSSEISQQFFRLTKP